MKLSKKQNLFSWRRDNHFDLLINGDQFFSEMLSAIDSAQHFVLFENYLTETSQITKKFIHAFTDAQARGVTVKLLLDDYGAKKLQQTDRQTLLDANIEIQFYNPFSIKHLIASLRRDHRKILIVDNKMAFVGGAGLTDDFLHPRLPQLSWLDVMVKIQGSIVVDWIEVFKHTWQKKQPDLKLREVETTTNSKRNKMAGRVLLAESLRRQEINRAFVRNIRHSKHRVWLMTPYFVPARKIRRVLKQAAKRNVDVRLILAGEISDHPWVTHAAHGFYARLLRNGVRIFELSHRFPHAKIQLCDNWTSIGSSNLDRWNQHWNMDANQEIDSSMFADQVKSLFINNFKHCKEIQYEQWCRRSPSLKIREWIWGRVVIFLEIFTRAFRR